MRAFRFLLAVLAASFLLPLNSCTEAPTGPGVGPGNILEATVNGTKLTIDVGSDIANFNTYTVASHEVNFGGTVVGTPSKTITARFTYDIDKGPFPKTLGGDSISIIYIETSTSGVMTYDCPTTGGSCSITVTGSNGEIVDGTFTATLAESTDPTKTVTITNGKFSARLKRQ
jgi:hypothetical protein